MKEVYLAYFDLLGFKEFISNNEDETLIRRMGHIFRDIELSLSLGEFQAPIDGVKLANISNSKLNCINISDTIVFWTNDCGIDELKELIKVSYEFNWKQISYNFPIRGVITKGKIRFVNGNSNNRKGGSYSVKCLYGKGIVEAHNKAENQNWAGSVIDNSIIIDLNRNDENLNFLLKYAIKYKVPYKAIEQEEEEFVFRLSENLLNSIAFENASKNIIDTFKLDNKSVDNPSVQAKIENTIKFLNSFKE